MNHEILGITVMIPEIVMGCDQGRYNLQIIPKVSPGVRRRVLKLGTKALIQKSLGEKPEVIINHF